jgi:hypothetical protein
MDAEAPGSALLAVGEIHEDLGALVIFGQLCQALPHASRLWRPIEAEEPPDSE